LCWVARLQCAIYGNFSAPKVHEIVVSRGKVLELLRPDESGKVQVIHSTEVFGAIRSLSPFRHARTAAGLPLLWMSGWRSGQLRHHPGQAGFAVQSVCSAMAAAHTRCSAPLCCPAHSPCRCPLPSRFPGSLQDYVICGSDSGRIVILLYSKEKNCFTRVHQETFGKSGCRCGGASPGGGAGGAPPPQPPKLLS
jgi:hypothetical protein